MTLSESKITEIVQTYRLTVGKWLTRLLGFQLSQFGVMVSNCQRVQEKKNEFRIHNTHLYGKQNKLMFCNTRNQNSTTGQIEQ